MTAKGMIRSIMVAIAAAALWGTPISAVQARYHHGDPPRQTPAPQDRSGTEEQGSKPQEASPDADAGSREECFRRYDHRCDEARQNYAGHREGPD
jgi:hypothetical protein